MNLEVRDGFSRKKASREKIEEKTLCGGYTYSMER
jgi:hypothetical protein